ncbi:MAG: hypothetical protein ACI30A_06830 [Paludibacteraceae bacterium]
MEIELIRYTKRDWGIDGMLLVNKKKVCNTVEHPRYCKPVGQYEVTLRQNPFTHGDGALRSVNGEIIVGKYALPGMVTCSAQTYNTLYDRLKKEWKRGHEVRLTIR